MYRFRVTPITKSQPSFKWVLDAPQANAQISLESLNNSTVLVRGWLASANNANVQLQLRFAGHTVELAINQPRRDVNAFLQQHTPSLAEQRFYGFEQQVPWHAAQAQLVCTVDGVETVLCEVGVAGSLAILEGSDGWLFLDNDANRSVEQFKGEYLLYAPHKWLWSWYLLALKRLAKQHNLPYVFLVAPAKEMVVTQHYPVVKGHNSPVEQVQRLANLWRVNLLYPDVLLKLVQPRAFRKADTHWSLSGAKVAWLACLVKLAVPVEPVQAAFANDTYKDQPLLGDLGNKVYPPLSAKEQMLVGFSYRSLVAYDNHLPNFGRVIITLNPQAVYAKRLLIFGSSSTYTMMHYVARTFSEVVFVHSAANVDADFLKRVYADYCLVQSNGRFLVKPPSVRYQLLADIRRKWHQLSAAEQADTQQKLQGYLAAELPAWVVDLHRHTLGAVL